MADCRVSVGSLDSKVLGTCLLCNSSFDDYSSRSRCIFCRMLVLICKSCQDVNSTYACELCQKTGKDVGSVLEMKFYKSVEISEGGGVKEAVSTLNSTEYLPIVARPIGTQMSRRRLRILCLHGFRQNASGFKGRSASLAKKLKNIAELIFIDAPHALPFIYQLPLPDHHRNLISSHQSKDTLPMSGCNRKFAWLVGHGHTPETNSDWKISDCKFDYQQYQHQTEGFDESLSYLKTKVSEGGPFDGILGFSQGAAMAALLCAHKEKLKGEIDFRFAVLCSGFAVNMGDLRQGSINCPSLHIFGNDKGSDRQIENRASKRLASLFDDASRGVIEHDFGHMIPTRSPFIDQIKDFLHRFL